MVLPPQDRLSSHRGFIHASVNGEKPEPKPDRWPKDEFGRSESLAQFTWIFLLVLGFAAVLYLSFSNRSAMDRRKEVIAYCAQDQVFAEAIFRDFQQQTGIKVRAVYDSEAVKTVGLANRLLAERSNPRCDVFWGNEEMRARQLAVKGVFRETNGWAAFGYRSRRIVINTNLLPVGSAPGSLLELTNQAWRRKIALAYPQFGTTATHFHALRVQWGEALWEAWCRGLVANEPLLVDGNSVVVRMVGRGEALLGLTDSDDIAAAQREVLPLYGLPINAETLLIPNTVAVIRGAPHAEPAQRLFEFLQRPEIAQRLVSAKALESPALDSAPQPTLKPDWDAILRDLDPVTEKLNKIFLR